jgi:hypothetical protein
MLAPQLAAQQSDSAMIAVGRFVERAQRIAEHGDTVAYQKALAVLDSAQRIARAGAIFRTRAIIGVAYAESLLARARVTGACVDVRRTTEIVQLADKAMPSDDLSNGPRLIQAAVGLAALHDSLPLIRRRACG